MDLHKSYAVDHPVLGDAKLTLRQFIDCGVDMLAGKSARPEQEVANEIARVVKLGWRTGWRSSRRTRCRLIPIG